MSDNQNETGQGPSALLNADKFYSDPTEATEAGENPEVEEDVDIEASAEIDADAEAETELDDDAGEADSTPYGFDEDSGEYTFKAGGKEITANTDKLIEYAQKGVGFEKNLARSKEADRQRAEEHKQALDAVATRETELQSLIESVESLLQEEALDDDLLDHDPGEYLRREKRINERKAKIEEAKKSIAGKQDQQLAEKANKSWTALTKAKGWETAEDAEKGFKDIAAYMKKSDINMNEIYPHTAYLAFEKAAKYDAIQAKKAEAMKEVRKAPKSVKSQKATKPPKERSAVDVLYGT